MSVITQTGRRAVSSCVRKSALTNLIFVFLDSQLVSTLQFVPGFLLDHVTNLVIGVVYPVVEVSTPEHIIVVFYLHPLDNSTDLTHLRNDFFNINTSSRDIFLVDEKD